MNDMIRAVVCHACLGLGSLGILACGKKFKKEVGQTNNREERGNCVVAIFRLIICSRIKVSRLDLKARSRSVRHPVPQEAPDGPAPVSQRNGKRNRG